MAESSMNHIYLPIVTLIVATIGWIYTKLSSPMARLPGPLLTNFTHIPLKWNSIKGRKPYWIHGQHEKYGPIVRIGPHEASIQDTAATQQMYRIKGEFLKSDFYDKVATGRVNVFTTRDTEIHKRQRRLLSGEMAESNLTKHLPAVESRVRLAIQRMREEMQHRKATDVFHWWLCMATDVIGELSFGESFKMLETGEQSQYIRDMQGVAQATAIRVALPFLKRLSQYIWVPVISNSFQINERVIQYAEKSLQRHYRIVEEQGDDANPTLFSKLYKTADDDKLSFSEVRDNALAYIIAGSDTTSNTLTYLIWMVCKHPEVMAKLLEELQSLPSDFEYSDVKDLPYLNHVIEETTRLYPAVPSGLPRVVPQGGAQLAGHYVPAGYIVSAQAYSMHHDSAVFPEPTKYDPSRWENPTRAMKDSYLPFGGGSRVCIGLHLARVELRLAVAHFFTAFPNAKVSSREGFKDEDMKPELYFLMTPTSHRCLIEIYE